MYFNIKTANCLLLPSAVAESIGAGSVTDWYGMQESETGGRQSIAMDGFPRACNQQGNVFVDAGSKNAARWLVDWLTSNAHRLWQNETDSGACCDD